MATDSSWCRRSVLVAVGALILTPRKVFARMARTLTNTTELFVDDSAFEPIQLRNLVDSSGCPFTAQATRIVVQKDHGNGYLQMMAEIEVVDGGEKPVIKITNHVDSQGSPIVRYADRVYVTESEASID